MTSVSTTNVLPLLANPATVTTTGPVVAAAGTVAMMLVALQLMTVAATLLNVTVLMPCVMPKFDPAIVIDWPGMPALGLTKVMVGGNNTVNVTLLLA